MTYKPLFVIFQFISVNALCYCQISLKQMLLPVYIFYSRFQAPFVAGLKKEGDERFRAKDYQKAASIYLMALNFPVPPFLNVSVIYEQLFRRRAQCLFKLVSILPRKQIRPYFQ